MSFPLQPGQIPPNADVDESISITKLMGTAGHFRDFGEIWLSHLMRSDWADMESITQSLEQGTIMVPVHMVAYEIFDGMIIISFEVFLPQDCT